MEKKKHISIRIDEKTLEKFHYVSKYEDRSASGQIMFLINKCIREFEEKHGEMIKYHFFCRLNIKAIVIQHIFD